MKPKTLLLCLAALLLAVPLVADDAARPAPVPTLSAEEMAQLLQGLDLPPAVSAGSPPCPTIVVPCKSSIPGQSCTMGTCENVSLGPCCTTSGGGQFCCPVGTVTARICPCDGPGCPGQIVTWRCQ